MKINEVEIDVRFSDIDSMNIAHNSKYYIWFEIGRFEFAKNILMLGVKELTTEYLLPVIRSNCKYLKGIHFGDKLGIRTYMYMNDTTKIYFYYTIENQIKQLCAVGSTQHVLLSQDNKCIYKFTKELQEKFDYGNKNYSDCFLTEERRILMDTRINR